MKRGELEKETSFIFRRTDGLLRRFMERKVGFTGVYPSQHRLLMELGCNPGSSQTELAERMEVSTAAVAVSLKKLEKKGYISRLTDKDDNRVNQVTITEKGKSVIEQSRRIFRETDKEMFDGFTEEEIAETRDYLLRVHRNLERMNEALEREEENR